MDMLWIEGGRLGFEGWSKVVALQGINFLVHLVLRGLELGHVPILILCTRCAIVLAESDGIERMSEPRRPPFVPLHSTKKPAFTKLFVWLARQDSNLVKESQKTK